ncbi:MAG: DUF5916 domain-containing protein [Planctomycetota bacterium]
MALAIAALCAPAEARQPQEKAAGTASPAEPPRLAVTRTGTRPKLDGRLDDPAWQAAAVLDTFTQVDPEEGDPPSQRTELRVLYDDNNLYVGFRCFDSEPDLIRATVMARDASLEPDDRVAFTIDPFFDRRNGFLFEVGAAGAMRDAIIEGGSARADWNGIWNARVSRDARGWSAEIVVPFQTVGFDPETDRWGFNASRVVRRINESIRWAAPVRTAGVSNMATAGVLEGFDGDIDQGLGIEFKPFYVGTTTLESVEGRPGETDFDSDVGFDLFYRVTPTVRAAVTFNTDFAEAEVDDRQVNLTRFPLFFPERRDFFLEEAGVFEFGGVFQSPRPFFSRRIGIVGGVERGILAGTRVTGRRGRTRFGLLNVQMEDDEELGEKNLTVARVTTDLLEESQAGLIFTNGLPGERGQNQLIGGDARYRTSRFLGDNQLEVGAFFQIARNAPTDGLERTDAVVGGRLNLTADPWNANFFFAQVGPDFNPGLGFVQRPGTREHVGGVGYTFRPNGDTIRTVELRTNATLFTDLDAIVDTFNWDVLRVTAVGPAGDSVSARVFTAIDNLNDPFTIVDNLVIPADSYEDTGFGVSVGTASSRTLAVSGGYTYRTFFGGDRADYSAGLTARPNRFVRASTDLTFTSADVDTTRGREDFDVFISRTTLALQFSPLLTWDTNLQYDNASDSAGLNTRLRYEPVPGQELFVVYNEGFDVDGEEFKSSGQTATVKIGLTFRY